MMHAAVQMVGAVVAQQCVVLTVNIELTVANAIGHAANHATHITGIAHVICVV